MLPLISDGTKEHFAYDENGNLVTRTVPTPADHTFAYNGVNKRTAYTGPLQKQTVYVYDKQRRTTKVIKPSGKTIETTYTNGRVTAVTTPEGTTDYSYACQSNISSITKPSAGSGADEKIDYAYDGTLLTSITQSGVLNQSITYSYNNDFLPQNITYAGKAVPFAYNKDNELMRSGDFSIRRDKEGTRIRVNDTHLHRKYLFNRYGELKSVKDDVLFVKLKRNENGQIVKKRELLGDHKRVYLYAYNAKGRLIKVYRGTGKHKRVVESYTYDANGNRASATVYGVTATGKYTLDDALTVYSDNTYRYDEDGYLVEKTTPQGSTTYSYNTLGALTKVVLPNGTTIEYPQDALNRRAAKKVKGQIVEKYLWADLTTLLAVYDNNDNLVQRFEYADQRMPVSMTQNGQKYYLHYDQVGSLRAVSDSSGNVVKEITYDTYGNIISDSNPLFNVPFGFGGGLYDPDTKLTHFGYREYDTYTGKWTAKDPIGFAGGDSNLYGYVLGDPVLGIDPEGLLMLCTTKHFIYHQFWKDGNRSIGFHPKNGLFFADAEYHTDDHIKYKDDALCQDIGNDTCITECILNYNLFNKAPMYDLYFHNCRDEAMDMYYYCQLSCGN